MSRTLLLVDADQVRSQLEKDGVKTAAEAMDLDWVQSLHDGASREGPNDVPTSVGAIWSFCNTQISQLPAEALELLNLLVHLDANAVPLALLASSGLAAALSEDSSLRKSLSQSSSALPVVRRIVRALER